MYEDDVFETYRGYKGLKFNDNEGFAMDMIDFYMKSIADDKIRALGAKKRRKPLPPLPERPLKPGEYRVASILRGHPAYRNATVKSGKIDIRFTLPENTDSK